MGSTESREREENNSITNGGRELPNTWAAIALIDRRVPSFIGVRSGREKRPERADPCGIHTQSENLNQ